MKIKAFVCLLLSGIAIGWAQTTAPSPVRITSYNRATAVLSWTNYVCANLPVYELLRANSPTGGWQHVFYATNAQSLVLTNRGSTPGAVFHRIGWASDTPMVFKYSFDERWGCPAVTGILNVSLANLASDGWQLEEWFCAFDRLHPVGSGTFVRGNITATNANHILTLWFNAGTFLEGTLEQKTTNGHRIYSGIAGTVYRSGVAGNSPIGTFTATRTQ